MRNLDRHVTLSLLVAVTSALAGACGGGGQSTPPAQQPPGYAPPGYATAAPTYAPAPGYPGAAPAPAPGYPGAAPTYAPAPTAAPTYAPAPMPAPAPAPAAAGGGTATPLDPSAAGAAGLALNAYAASDAPNMAKELPAIAGNFQPGQTLEQPITIQPGKCYTFVAAGIGPTALDVALVAQTAIPGLAPIMGDAKGKGQKTVLGGGTACIKLALIPMAVPAKWVITATSGGGVVAGQAFSK